MTVSTCFSFKKVTLYIEENNTFRKNTLDTLERLTFVTNSLKGFYSIITSNIDEKHKWLRQILDIYCSLLTFNIFQNFDSIIIVFAISRFETFCHQFGEHF